MSLLNLLGRRELQVLIVLAALPFFVSKVDASLAYVSRAHVVRRVLIFLFRPLASPGQSEDAAGVGDSGRFTLYHFLLGLIRLLTNLVNRDGSIIRFETRLRNLRALAVLMVVVVYVLMLFAIRMIVRGGRTATTCSVASVIVVMMLLF